MTCDYELRESVPTSPLLTSTLDSDWLPFSEEALLRWPDWSDTDFFDLGLYSVTTTVTLFTVTSHVWALLLSTFFNRGGCLLFFPALVPCVLFFFSALSFPPPSFTVPSLTLPSFLFFAGVGLYCWAAIWGLIRGLRVEVPLRTSHIRHLNASSVFL